MLNNAIVFVRIMGAEKAVAIIKNIIHNRHMRQISKYVNLAKESIYKNDFYVDIRQPINRIYMEVGNGSVLSGNYVFETELGHIKIGERTYIGGGTFISREGIEIGDDVIIAWGGLVYDHNSHSIYWDERKDDVTQVYKDIKKSGNQILNKNWDVVKSAPIKICDKVWIGANVTILKGVTVGEGAVIGAGSVVTHDVKPWTIVAGNPAQIVKELDF